MKTFAHVEDYLEALSGDDFTWIKPTAPLDVHIKLARYDVSIVRNMADNTVWGTALTDRQADLAIKLILKYRKQFAKFDIDVSPIEHNAQFRNTPRKINRERLLSLVDGCMELRYPYDGPMVEQMRQFSKESQGQAQWLHNEKKWRIALTEYNLNYVVTWAQSNHFNIDPELLDLYEKVLQTEHCTYDIVLTRTPNGYTVTNSADSLKDYIQIHLGQDLVKLVDHAGVLGYQVDPEILSQAEETYGSALLTVMEHQTHCSPTEDNFDNLMQYAEITNRYPVCIYNPAGYVFDLHQWADSNQIVKFDHNGKNITTDVDVNRAKIIYASKIPSHSEFRIPLLISTAEMMYGGRRLDWINRAEKIVYFVNVKLT